MKYPLNVFWIMFLLVSIEARDSPHYYTHIGTHMTNVASHPKFDEHVHNHTTLHICKDSQKEMQEASDRASSCVLLYEPKKETWCYFVHNKLRECLKPLVEEISKCFPAKSKDVPEFVLEEFMSVTKYICKAKGRDLLELTVPCIYDSKNWDKKCLTKVSEKLEHFQKEPPTKQELCSSLRDIRVCFKEHLDSACSSDITINDALKLYDSLLEPCNKINKH